jgi:hypothetical protein
VPQRLLAAAASAEALGSARAALDCELEAAARTAAGQVLSVAAGPSRPGAAPQLAVGCPPSHAALFDAAFSARWAVPLVSALAAVGLLRLFTDADVARGVVAAWLSHCERLLQATEGVPPDAGAARGLWVLPVSASLPGPVGVSASRLGALSLSSPLRSGYTSPGFPSGGRRGRRGSDASAGWGSKHGEEGEADLLGSPASPSASPTRGRREHGRSPSHSERKSAERSPPGGGRAITAAASSSGSSFMLGTVPLSLHTLITMPGLHLLLRSCGFEAVLVDCSSSSSAAAHTADAAGAPHSLEYWLGGKASLAWPALPEAAASRLAAIARALRAHLAATELPEAADCSATLLAAAHVAAGPLGALLPTLFARRRRADGAASARVAQLQSIAAAASGRGGAKGAAGPKSPARAAAGGGAAGRGGGASSGGVEGSDAAAALLAADGGAAAGLVAAADFLRGDPSLDAHVLLQGAAGQRADTALSHEDEVEHRGGPQGPAAWAAATEFAVAALQAAARASPSDARARRVTLPAYPLPPLPLPAHYLGDSPALAASGHAHERIAWQPLALLVACGFREARDGALHLPATVPAARLQARVLELQAALPVFKAAAALATNLAACRLATGAVSARDASDSKTPHSAARPGLDAYSDDGMGEGEEGEYGEEAPWQRGSATGTAARLRTGLDLGGEGDQSLPLLLATRSGNASPNVSAIPFPQQQQATGALRGRAGALAGPPERPLLAGPPAARSAPSSALCRRHAQLARGAAARAASSVRAGSWTAAQRGCSASTCTASAAAAAA